ncbi:hypothetical protein BC833DRAFT_525423, partial [Globomyces pollinis-pini]
GSRYHTSKINKFDDVAMVESFGFRGEALSSLCALSTVEILTSSQPPLGNKLNFNSKGEIIGKSYISRAKGTTVTLIKLFENTPVRFQELKRHHKREFSKVVDCIYGYCLSRPSIRFAFQNTYMIKGSSQNHTNTLLQTSGSNCTRQVFSELFGSKTSGQLVDICFEIKLANSENEISILTVMGMMSKFVPFFNLLRPQPFHGRAENDRQFLFVNGYPIQMPKLSRMINQVYHEYNQSQYPMYSLCLEIPKDLFDRNVTPDKRTLILQLEEELVNSVSEELKSIFEPFRGVFQTKKSVTGQPVPKNKSTFLQHTIPKIIDNSKFSDQFKERIMTNHPKSIEVDLNVIRSQLEASTSSKHAQFKVDYSEGDILNQTISITKDKFKAMKIHGQFNLGFILASLDDHLFIIDQHASDEKFNYEQLKYKTPIKMQPLITPLKLNVPRQHEYLLEDYRESFKLIGFELEKLHEVWYLKTVPHVRDQILEISDFESILSHLSVSKNLDLSECPRIQRYNASKACRTSVMIGTALSLNKMQSIINNMGLCEQPWNCPHGRPTIRLLTKVICEQQCL